MKRLSYTEDARCLKVKKNLLLTSLYSLQLPSKVTSTACLSTIIYAAHNTCIGNTWKVSLVYWTLFYELLIHFGTQSISVFYFTKVMSSNASNACLRWTSSIWFWSSEQGTDGINNNLNPCTFKHHIFHSLLHWFLTPSWPRTTFSIILTICSI